MQLNGHCTVCPNSGSSSRKLHCLYSFWFDVEILHGNYGRADHVSLRYCWEHWHQKTEILSISSPISILLFTLSIPMKTTHRRMIFWGPHSYNQRTKLRFNYLPFCKIPFKGLRGIWNAGKKMYPHIQVLVLRASKCDLHVNTLNIWHIKELEKGKFLELYEWVLISITNIFIVFGKRDIWYTEKSYTDKKTLWRCKQIGMACLQVSEFSQLQKLEETMFSPLELPLGAQPANSLCDTLNTEFRLLASRTVRK